MRLSDAYCWGIFREEAHSPGRESDDSEILRLTAKGLEAKGFQVDLMTPDELVGQVESKPRGIFLMCERPEALQALASAREPTGCARSTARPPCSAPIASA